MKIQFILKKNETYGFVSYTRRSSGLWNSTNFIVNSLKTAGLDVDIVEVRDNNDIDREVTRFRPDICVIEALWVVPEKFDVLKRLHPKVDWYVHLHSQVPFLALEGIAMQWLMGYKERGVGVISNAKHLYNALRTILPDSLHVYLPNVYTGQSMPMVDKHDEVNVGCFGAIRPLKNQLVQALAAIRFAKEMCKPLKFHVNASRVETMGDPVLKNIVQLFEVLGPDATLVQHPWYEPDQFLQVLRGMDLGMQVSLSETFNVVSADYVIAGVPIVVSEEVAWASAFNKCDMNAVDSMVKVMHRTWRNRLLVLRNQYLLKKHGEMAAQMWLEFAS